jgi:hypothetical protein
MIIGWEKTLVLMEKPAPVPICPPQMPLGLLWVEPRPLL